MAVTMMEETSSAGVMLIYDG